MYLSSRKASILQDMLNIYELLRKLRYWQDTLKLRFKTVTTIYGIHLFDIESHLTYKILS
jgi:hypothetical protein